MVNLKDIMLDDIKANRERTQTSPSDVDVNPQAVPLTEARGHCCCAAVHDNSTALLCGWLREDLQVLTCSDFPTALSIPSDPEYK